MTKSALTISIAVALFGATVMSGGAFAARCEQPPCGGGGGKGPPNGGEEPAAAQNLSVPTIAVGTMPGGLSCVNLDGSSPKNLVEPTGTPLTGFSVDGGAGYYWVQKVHEWQAQCFPATTASVYGNWGDNLEGDAKLKVGSPIRVEIVLTNTDAATYADSLLGYTVIKLEPGELDRNSPYGHLAGGSVEEGFTSLPAVFTGQSWLVHDSQMAWSLQQDPPDGPLVIDNQPITPEINATGKVVYGYNLRVSKIGPYRIIFNTSNNVQFTGQDATNGGLIYFDDDDDLEAYIDINVVQGGGGGGGKDRK